MNPGLGKYIIIIGLCLLVIGIIIYFFHDKLNWIGNLPGDIKVKRENFSFYFPITTMILFSIILSALIYIVRKFF